MDIISFDQRFEEIISSYTNESGSAINYCCDDSTGESLKIMREASEHAMREIKTLLMLYLSSIN